MNTSILTLRIFLMLFHLLYLNVLTAQVEITSIAQESIASIGHDTSNLVIQINNAVINDSYDIHVDLNDQGIEMINLAPNLVTVTGGDLDSIKGTLNDPIIYVTATSPNFELVVPRMATCATYVPFVDPSITVEIFNDKAKIGTGGDVFTPAANYQVNYAALNILSVVDSPNSISPTTTVERKIRIAQGLPGYLNDFKIDLTDIDGVLGFSNFRIERGATNKSKGLTIEIITNVSQELIQIVDVNGREVKQINFHKDQGNLLKIDINEFSPGFYFIQTSSGLSTRFIVSQ